MHKFQEMRHQILLLLLIKHLLAVVDATHSLPWPNAHEVIQAVCPYTKICHVPPSKTGPVDDCCTGCQCGNDCTYSYDCCLLNNSKSKYESCLYLRTKSNDKFGFTPAESKYHPHYVVTKAPENGCHLNKGKCDANDTSTMFPVFSKTTQKIYFNKDCATCHGLYDVEQPTFNLLCDDFGLSLSLNFDKEISKFLDGDKSSFCFLKFDFSFHTSHRKCAIHTSLTIDAFNSRNEIKNADTLRSIFNVPTEEIIDACLSSFHSPVLNSAKNILYPNPFCYVYAEGSHEKEECYTNTGNLSGLDFIVLLNQQVIDFFQPSSFIHSQPKTIGEVCARNSDLTKYEKCRHISCPLGHILDKTGMCNFIGTRVFTNGRMNIFLNVILKSEDGYDYNDLKDVNLSNVIHLPVDWNVAFWGVSVDSTNASSSNGNELLVILMLLNNDIPKGILSIKSRLNTNVSLLNRQFKLLIYPKKIIQKQNFPMKILAQIQCSKGIISGIPDIQDEVPNCWKMIDCSLPVDVPVNVDGLSKLYFCELVQLYNGEYHLLANETILFNRIRGTYLYENEFLVVIGENGERVVKICKNDSGLDDRKLFVNFAFKRGFSNYLKIMCVYIIYLFYILT